MLAHCFATGAGSVQAALPGRTCKYMGGKMHKQLIIAAVVCAFGGTQAAWAATETVVKQSTGAANINASMQGQGTRTQLSQEMQDHRLAQQKAESEFLGTLSGKTTAERTEAIAEFKEKQHKDYVSSMKAKLAENKQMTDEDKTAFLARIEQQYKTVKEYDDKQFEESQKALAAMSKPGLTKEQKAALQKEHAAKMKAAQAEQNKKQTEEGKAFRDKMKAEAKAKAAEKKAASK